MASSSGTAVGSQTCKASGCEYLAVRGSSFCTEEHFEELQEERKARGGYRTSTPVQAQDYSATLRPASNPAKRGRPGRELPQGVTREQIRADTRLSVTALMAKYGISRSTAMRFRRNAGTSQSPPMKAAKEAADPGTMAIAGFESEISRLETKIGLLRKAVSAIREVQQ